jgi:hypothetical protein
VTREPRGSDEGPSTPASRPTGEQQDDDVLLEDEFVYDSSSEIDDHEIEGRRQPSPQPTPSNIGTLPTQVPSAERATTSHNEFFESTSHMPKLATFGTSVSLNSPDFLNNTYIGPYNPEWDDVEGFMDLIIQRNLADDGSASSKRLIHKGNLKILSTVRSNLAPAVWLLLLPAITDLESLYSRFRTTLPDNSTRHTLLSQLDQVLRRVNHVKSLAKGAYRGEHWAQSQVHLKYAEKAFNGRPAPFTDYNAELINAKNAPFVSVSHAPPSLSHMHSSSTLPKGKTPARPGFARRTENYPRTPGAHCTYCNHKGHTEPQCMKKQKDTHSG